MNATQISITDPMHWGDQWTGPAPFEIETQLSTMADWPNAPVTVHLCEGVTPERAAYLLRQITEALERNGSQWLPDLAAIERAEQLATPESERPF